MTRTRVLLADEPTSVQNAAIALAEFADADPDHRYDYHLYYEAGFWPAVWR